MKRQKINTKNDSNGCLGCLMIIVIVLVTSFGVTLFNSYSHRTEEKPQTIEEKLNEVSKNTELKVDGKNAIITIKDEIITSGNTFINIAFPELAAKDLKVVQKEGYENIIVKVNTDFLDEKGNSSEGVLISAMFEDSTIKDINFDNWVDQVTADSEAFYDLSSAYYIQPRYYMDNKDDKTVPKMAAKTLTNAFWNENGY
ncbi:hypothetical protein GUI51_09320 [Enterococcus mundtii]|uniref:Uncharacterized protein n=1 Tax=Enterococcus mundtii TaxID=53346 RepID=A0ABQ0VCB2_ENTMU|nr:hypothetical protein [Enterococcus mundtii]GEN18121.1 hypothetical protein LAC02_14020 [Ligilactobacillus acidipiscis]AUB53025.1 hypothetical protein EM4838_08465 [Enterococcus mundtii]MZZ58331.1 hypothetical protein [Enterococcus mundtii]MZZ61307.1 hypothetical protein [Enterococcus mundtii]MZZ68291.1 hypothetical protein [Enterococcus mundtii]